MSWVGTPERRGMGATSLTTFIPYALDGNLGPTWNGIFESLPADGWAAILDHDAMFTTPIWYKQVMKAIARYPEGTFSCVSNRIGVESRWQSVNHDDMAADEHDMRAHRIHGAMLAKDGTITDVTDKELMAGMFFVMSKKTYDMIGPFPNGLRGLDNAIHAWIRQKGLRLYCIEGLYVYHWYRADGHNAVSSSLRYNWRDEKRQTA